MINFIQRVGAVRQVGLKNEAQHNQVIIMLGIALGLPNLQNNLSVDGKIIYQMKDLL